MQPKIAIQSNIRCGINLSLNIRCFSFEKKSTIGSISRVLPAEHRSSRESTFCSLLSKINRRRLSQGNLFIISGILCRLTVAGCRHVVRDPAGRRRHVRGSDRSGHSNHSHTQVHQRRKGKESRSCSVALVSDGERQARVGNRTVL